MLKEYYNLTNKIHEIHIGYVKENDDFQNMGRLGVYIPELCGPNDYIYVTYISPFLGVTEFIENSNVDYTNYEQQQTSYGFWAIPPDKDTMVLIAFINGDISRGVWLGCYPQQYMNQMIPNIPVGDAYNSEDPKPVTEMNKNDKTLLNKHLQPRAVHTRHYEAIRNQGLKSDIKRGFSQKGARYRSPDGKVSQVIGMLSPKGSYWSIEDNEGDEKIRLRTKSGVQLLLDESEGFIYMINKDGSGWVEVTPEGRLLVYAEDAIAMRTKGDISLKADKSIYMDAGENIKMKTGNDTQLQGKNITLKSSDNMIFDAENKVSLRGEQFHSEITNDCQFYTGGVLTLGSDDFNINSGGKLNITSADAIDIHATTDLKLSGLVNSSLCANGALTLVTDGLVALQGSTINMNMGGNKIIADAAIPCSPVTVKVEDLEEFEVNDIEQPLSDDDPIETPISTIVPIMTTHEPCTSARVQNDDS